MMDPTQSTAIDTPAGDGGKADQADRAVQELDDALYYLRHDCEPCAERHFQLALRHGATVDQVAATRQLAASGVD
jgi:hypothetical protein